MAKLVVISPDLKGLSHELDARWVTIGRNVSNNFQLVEASVSGQHCEVQLRGQELIVRDMHSTNGTLINGKVVSEGVLKPGEILRLGELQLRLDVSASPNIPDRTGGSLATNPPAAKTKTDTEFSTENKSLKKHQVLLVDDSMAFLETFGELFDTLGNKSWEVHKAAAADQALAILQRQPIELAVLDINMPVLDGVQLLGVIHRRYPDIKKVILTGHATEANRVACLANGAELFLEKPATADGIKFVFNVLNDLILWTQREGFSGTLRQAVLTDIIQMQCLGRNSCILEVRNQQTRGEIFIESGAIVHATTGKLTGEKAFQLLLALNNGEFRLQIFKNPPARTVQGSWEVLLMEAARVRDEQLSKLSGDDTVLITRTPTADKPAPTAGTAVPSEPSPADQSVKPAEDITDSDLAELGKDIVVVSTYDGKWHPTDNAKK